MSFSASTCLSNTGTATLGLNLNIYSNPISPTNPGTFVIQVLTADITGGNCPYVLDLPDGTTSIRISDPTSGCYCDIPISDNNMCLTCDLNFNTYTSPSVGNIVAGDITGSCDASISNYLINWYDVTDPFNPIFKFSSGKGSLFAPYTYTHPLTGSSSVLALPGEYEARLDKIELNNIEFSRTGGTGTVLADLDCLPSIVNGNPIIIDALTCSNGGGSSDLPQYEHRFAYSATTGGATPLPLSTVFQLSAGTKYFPWKFKGFEIPDKLKLTFSGSAYADPITLEYWEVGNSLPSDNYTYTTFPKSADTSEFFGKVTVLSGLTVNANDSIIIEVTPSTSTTQTSWIFYCGCLEDVNCDICIPPTATTVSGNTSYTNKIVTGSITALTSTCGVFPSMTISGCSLSDMTGNTLVKYGGQFKNSGGLSTKLNNHITFGPVSSGYDKLSQLIYYNQQICSFSFIQPTTPCNNLGSGMNITYDKSPGLFKVTSNSMTPIDMIYTSYTTNVSPIFTPFSGDNTNIDYYRYFAIRYTTATGTTPCGDSVPNNTLNFHISSVVSTGTTGGGDYYIQFTMPTTTIGIPFTSCDLNCLGNVNSVVQLVNNSSTGVTNNYTGTTNVGAIRNQCISIRVITLSQTQSLTGTTLQGDWVLDKSQNVTIPSSGSTYTVIPSLSGVVCSDLGTQVVNGDNINTTSIIRINYRYDWEFFDPAVSLEDNYRIYAIRINSAGGSVFPIEKTLVYEFSGGTNTYTNSDYFV